MHLKTKVKIVLVQLFILLCNAESVRFERNVVAVGHPYYMIVLSLGDCHGKLNEEPYRAYFFEVLYIYVDIVLLFNEKSHESPNKISAKTSLIHLVCYI